MTAKSPGLCPPHPLLSPPGVPGVGGGVGVGPVGLLPDIPGPLLRPGAGPAAGDQAEEAGVLARVLADLHEQLALQSCGTVAQRGGGRGLKEEPTAECRGLARGHQVTRSVIWCS